MLSGQIQIRFFRARRLFCLFWLSIDCLDPFPASVAMDLQARTRNRLVRLSGSREVSQAGIGQPSNRLSGVDKQKGTTNWPPTFSDGDGESALLGGAHAKA